MYMRRLRGLSGDLGISEKIELFNQIMDGTTAAELKAARDAVWNKRTALEELYSVAYNMPSGSDRDAAIAQYRDADSALLTEQQSVNAAIAQYSAAVNTIQTYSLNYYQPPQLSGLGAIPVAVTVIVGVAAVAAALYGLSAAISSARGDSGVTTQKIESLANLLKSLGVAPSPEDITNIIDKMKDKSWLESIGDIFGNAGTLTRNIAIAGAVGFGMYLLYGVLKKRGKI
jgi:hypothetical protein